MFGSKESKLSRDLQIPKMPVPGLHIIIPDID
jgi:hypothetical protein